VAMQRLNVPALIARQHKGLEVSAISAHWTERAD
jgi:hypothetical protein